MLLMKDRSFLYELRHVKMGENLSCSRVYETDFNIRDHSRNHKKKLLKPKKMWQSASKNLKTGISTNNYNI